LFSQQGGGGVVQNLRVFLKERTTAEIERLVNKK
jgi:hypothetical protein